MYGDWDWPHESSWLPPEKETRNFADLPNKGPGMWLDGTFIPIEEHQYNYPDPTSPQEVRIERARSLVEWNTPPIVCPPDVADAINDAIRDSVQEQTDRILLGSVWSDPINKLDPETAEDIRGAMRRQIERWRDGENRIDGDSISQIIKRDNVNDDQPDTGSDPS